MTSPRKEGWLPLEAQLQELHRRGLEIADPAAAADVLSHVNYERFTGYGEAFEQSPHRYLPGTTFEQISHAHAFDRSLRDLLTESVELIELDLRTTVAHVFDGLYGPFGYTDATNFHHGTDHRFWLERLQQEAARLRGIVAKGAAEPERTLPHLPICAAVEVMSFGCLSRMLQGMKRADQGRVAARYGIQPTTLTSCVHHVVYVRNLCAHHSRIWDRTWAIKPDLPAGRCWTHPHLPGNHQLFCSLLVQSVLLRPITSEHAFTARWRQRVEDLIEVNAPACPRPHARMGLTSGWQAHVIWRPAPRSLRRRTLRPGNHHVHQA